MGYWKGRTVTLLIAALAGATSAIFASAPALAQNIVKFELWSRQDPSGPLRPANVVKAAERLNKDLAAEGSGKLVEVAVHESPAPGFDDDALQLLKVFGIGQGPDMFIAAHEDLRLPAGRLCAQARRLYCQISPIFRHDLSVAMAVGKMF